MLNKKKLLVGIIKLSVRYSKYRVTQCDGLRRSESLIHQIIPHIESPSLSSSSC